MQKMMAEFTAVKNATAAPLPVVIERQPTRNSNELSQAK
jgi:hypothetical protein